MASLIDNLLVDPSNVYGASYSQATSGNMQQPAEPPTPGASLPQSGAVFTTQFLRSSLPVQAGMPRVIQYADGSAYNLDTGELSGVGNQVLTVVQVNIDGTWTLSDGSNLDPILGTRIGADGQPVQIDPSIRQAGNFSAIAEDIGNVSEKVNNFGVSLMSIFSGPQQTVPGTEPQGSNLSAKGTGVFVVASAIILFLLVRG